MPNDFSFCSNASYARLSPDELKSLGKEAALDFVGSGIALNDAVVKVAQRHPSISTHQIRRIVEFANQEAFAHLFEKQAGDKNIEFTIADPAEVLHQINGGVRAMSITAFPEEYAEGPQKSASADVEADLALAQTFGVKLSSPVMEKAAECSCDELAADRILAKLGFGEGMPMAGSDPNAGPSADEHHEKMLSVQREIELAKKREELAKIQQKSQEAMGIAPPEGAPVEGQPQQGGQMPPDAAMQGAPQGMTAPAPMPEPQEPPQPLTGPMLAPPGAGVPKTASILNDVLNYIHAGRPGSALMVSDLEKSASLHSFKDAIRTQEKCYPLADPQRELVETRQKIAQLREEAVCAADTNRQMAKEAADRFHKEAEQFLWDNGNLGEVLHLMEHASPNQVILKVAAEALIKKLERRGLDKVAARVDLISYEMSNKGKTRVPDTNHPVAESFGSFCKLAMNQPHLDRARAELTTLSQQLDAQVSEVWRQNASRQ